MIADSPDCRPFGKRLYSLPVSRVLLAYSGSLNTTLAIPWLIQQKGHEVITFAANLGYGEYLRTLGDHALEAGASAAHIGDLRERFVRDFVLPALKANARYESGYFLAAALGRPLIAYELVRFASEFGCDTVAHGCTERGNNQVRFETAIAALAPDLKVIAPIREWNLRTLDDKLAFAKRCRLKVELDGRELRHLDGNLWGISTQPEKDADLWRDIPESSFVLTADPRKAPDAPTALEIDFERGEPKALDGKPLSMLAMIETLNRLGGKHGVGRCDIIENRVIGLKSREIYEAPAASILHTAHQALEDITLSKDLTDFKTAASQHYANLIYRGLWYSELRTALDGFFQAAQRTVSGQVRLELYKGACRVVGRRSAWSLHDPARTESVSPADAAGFARISALASRVEGRRRGGHPELRQT